MTTLGRLVSIALVLALVACGSDDDPGPGGRERNDADETFVQVAGGSIGTLRQIVELAEDRSGSAEVAELAEEIEGTLADVAEQLAAWEDDWDLPVVVNSPAADDPVNSSVAHLAQQEKSEDWERLEELEGEEFDVLWIDVVTESVEAVQTSAETVVERGTDADVRTLAESLGSDCSTWADELIDLTS